MGKIITFTYIVFYSIFAPFLVKVMAQDKIQNYYHKTSLCVISKNPVRYKWKSIKIRAFYTTTFEGVSLVDKGCNLKDGVVLAKLECPTSKDCEAMEKKIKKKVNGNVFDGEESLVTVIGFIEIIELKVEIPNSPKMIFHIQKVN